jgi:hypothetical protein
MAERVNSSALESVRRAMLAGRQSDSFSMDHNPDWKYNKMYGHIFDQILPDDDGYLMLHEPQRRYNFENTDNYAQNGPFTGQRTAPDLPSARDVIIMERSQDPGVKKMFEEMFGTEALDRDNRNRYGIRNPDYVPTPRARPNAAPLGPSTDEYSGDQSGMRPETFKTEGQPNPEEVYSYMPGLRERVAEHLRGPGPSRELKNDREDGSRFDRALVDAGGDQRANIQDYRLKAIENMMQRGGGQVQPGVQVQPEGEQMLGQPLPPPMDAQSLDDMINRHLQELREQQIQDDPDLGGFSNRR